MTNSFPTPKTTSIRNLSSKQSFDRGLWRFKGNLGHFGSVLGPVTSQKGPECKNLKILTLPSVFLPQKTLQYQIWDQESHFIGIYFGLSDYFPTISGMLPNFMNN